MLKKHLNEMGIESLNTFNVYKECLIKCSTFNGVNFFNSKDRILSLIRLIDDSKHLKTEHYLALYLLFTQSEEYTKIFEIETDRIQNIEETIHELLN